MGRKNLVSDIPTGRGTFKGRHVCQPVLTYLRMTACTRASLALRTDRLPRWQGRRLHSPPRGVTTRDRRCNLVPIYMYITYLLIGPILWGHSGPLRHALSLLSSSSLSWTSMRRRRATVATPGEWQCKTGGVRRLAVANGSNIFQMLLVFSLKAKKCMHWMVATCVVFRRSQMKSVRREPPRNACSNELAEPTH